MLVRVAGFGKNNFCLINTHANTVKEVNFVIAFILTVLGLLLLNGNKSTFLQKT